ncbi:vacuolar protein sorting-associated protein 18 homolog [Ctenocephalides felis]|uniref:vacuolar protein sorting-associated protein 18 homolog n=1 Tax=Ctenocephalides felis TaxID=7515 RepID=UPI000E6E17B7|nr:vacuolar protein sorting-associated protein 18 homolog [Ctenocephalides felis]
MTSIMDQYEQANQKNIAGSISDEPISGYNSRMEDSTPIFSKQKMQFTPSDKITHLAVANDILVLAMANNTLFRINLKQPDKNEEISLNKPAYKISEIFIDPYGNHLLIALTSRQPESSSELIYLNRKSNKLKASNKFRGYEITEVGWNCNVCSETTTGHILLGTSKGLIFETEMGLDGDKIFHSSLEQYWRQIFDIGKGDDIPITGLEFRKVNDTNKYIVLVTTPQRLYQFSGTSSSEDRSLLQQVFNSYLNKPEECIEMGSSLKYSKLKLYYNEVSSLPKSFGWLIEHGLYYGKIDPYKSDDSNFISKAEMLAFPNRTNDNLKSKSKLYPITFVMTEFHTLLVYNDKVVGISQLNNDVIFEDNYNEAFGKVVNIARDPAKGTIWLFTDKYVFRYKVTREERDVWKIYADKNEFALAKKYCNNNPLFYDKIQIKEAEMLYNEKKYKESALIFAETQSSFEGVCLKFLERNEIPALRLFLRRKLDMLKPQDKTQITMVIIWIIELYLNEIGNLRNRNLLDSQECHELQTEFDKFIRQPVVYENICNNKRVIYELMASHGDNGNLIKLTMLNEDFENVIMMHLYKGQYMEALDVLKRQSNNELFYRHCPILMEEIPKSTVQVLISRGKHLQPSKLLPALVWEIGCI